MPQLSRRWLLIVLLLAGCQSVNLDDEWLPLEQIKQNPAIATSETVMVTIGETVYVADLDKWLADHSGARLDAILKHEQLHSERQHAMGVTLWLGRYAVDPEFMWREESFGWYLQLKHYQRAGLRVNVDGVAQILASYENLGGQMIDYPSAKQWVLEVLDGHWAPSN